MRDRKTVIVDIFIVLQKRSKRPLHTKRHSKMLLFKVPCLILYRNSRKVLYSLGKNGVPRFY